MAAAMLIAETFGILVAIFFGKMIEKKLKEEGIRGHPYKLLFGNLKKMMKMSKAAKKQPLLNHDIIPWVNPLPLHLSNTCNKMFPAFCVCCDEMINRWEELVSKRGSCELDVADEFLNLGGDVISRAAFGSNIEEGRSIFLLQKEFFTTTSNRKAKHIHKKMISLIKGIIEKREDDVQRGVSDNDDVLGLLLKARNEENKSKVVGGRGLSTDYVIEECKEFYFAGQDTPTALLSWTMVVLSMHPEWQDRARNEVYQAIGKNKPKFDDLNHHRLMNMIFQEVLEIYPAIFLIRSTSKSTKLGDMTIPPGVQVWLWGDDALMFNPESFSEGVSKAAKEQLYFPFGWGPRMCIGLNFGMMEAKLILSQILQRFWFELSPSYTHAPQLTLIMKPQYGAQIILHKH
ncbi:unnamed protein product [Withania somnifera]